MLTSGTGLRDQVAKSTQKIFRASADRTSVYKEIQFLFHSKKDFSFFLAGRQSWVANLNFNEQVFSTFLALRRLFFSNPILSSKKESEITLRNTLNPK